MALSILLGFLTVGSSIALMGCSAWLISKAALHPTIAELSLAILGVRVFGISRGVFRYLERLVSHDVTFRLLKSLRLWFFRSIEPLAPAQLMQHRGGDLLARVVDDLETLQNFYVRMLAPPLIAILTALAISILIGAFAIVLLIPLWLAMLLVGLVLPYFVWRSGQRAGHQIVVQRAQLKTLIVDSIQGLGDLMAFNALPRQNDRLKQDQAVLQEAQFALAQRDNWVNALNVMIVWLAITAMLVLAVPIVDPILLAPISLTVLAAFEAFFPLSGTANHAGEIKSAGQRLFSMTNAVPQVQDCAQPKPLSPEPNIRFENISFRYAEDTALALRDVSFSIPFGQHIAVVGDSGAGKTSLVNLLLRFWNPTSGQVLLDDAPIGDYSLAAIRQHFGVVPQRPHFFNTTIEENLRLARPKAEMDAIRQAAQQAHIHDFIMTLPDAYNTMIGEQGLQLSGGERQRLAIARVLLKDAPIIILDEAIANLDAIHAETLMQELHARWREHTVISIAHQLNYLENMDAILVMRQSRIVERGQHSDLLASEGIYARMFAEQLKLLESHEAPPEPF